MNAIWKSCLPLALGAGVVVVVVIILARWQPVEATNKSASGPFPRYSVVETEGYNLIVTDNRSQTVYFYTIDKDKQVGSELKLRGLIGLEKVGKRALRPARAMPLP
jgi:hypothetical protein